MAHDYSTLREDWDLIVKEADFYGPNLRAVIAKAGGEERIKSCGRVFSGPFQVPAVAWHLHLHGNEVGIFPFGPGTTLAQGGSRAVGRPAVSRDHEDEPLDRGNELLAAG